MFKVIDANSYFVVKTSCFKRECADWIQARENPDDYFITDDNGNICE